MRTTISTVVLVLLLLVLWVGVAEPNATLGKVFQLAVGTSVPVGDDGLVVGFDAVPYDGRCAIGVFCIWEGDAASLLWAERPGEERTPLTVHTSSHFGQSVTYGAYTISLLQLTPYPVHLQPTDPESYVVTLVVTAPGIVTGAEASTWGRIKALYSTE